MNERYDILNIRQRGIGNPNPIKLGRCIKELERIYGIEHGGDRKTSSPKVSDLNQSDIAEMIGISVDTLNNYKKLTELIPELEDLVNTGILAPTTALGDDAIIIEVMEWMLDIQLGRRNLSPIQRIAVAEKYRPIYEKQAKENLIKAGNNYGVGKNKKPFQNSEKPISPINTTKKLAQTAGVSTDTYSKGKKILDSDNEELKKEVLLGKKSINAAYKTLQNENKKVQSYTVITMIKATRDLFF